jgi:Na+/proline symporter
MLSGLSYSWILTGGWRAWVFWTMGTGRFRDLSRNWSCETIVDILTTKISTNFNDLNGWILIHLVTRICFGTWSNERFIILLLVDLQFALN